MREAVRMWGAVLMPLLAVSAGTPARAQTVIDLSDVPICSRCELMPRAVARLGAADGDGIIESDVAEVRYDARTRTYAVFNVTGQHVLLFDETGRFRRRIGKAGGGPGEIRGLVDLQLRDSTLVALDREGPTLMVMAASGTVLEERRARIRSGQFRLASDSTIVVAAFGTDPSSAAFPMHLVSLRTGEPLRHLGATAGRPARQDPRLGPPILGASPGSAGFWLAPRAPFQLEEWAADGRLVRVIRARGSWFPGEVGGDPDGPPPLLLLAFGIDARQRLWTITTVPDERWREVPRGGREKFVLHADMGRFMDARIDVFDLRERRHLGTLRWDQHTVGLVEAGGELLVQRVVDDSDVPQVVVYRLEPGARR